MEGSQPRAIAVDCKKDLKHFSVFFDIVVDSFAETTDAAKQVDARNDMCGYLLNA